MPDYRSGFVAVVGRPNVGKSTLMNALLGQKVAAVSPRPQTTRRRQLGILTSKSAQLIFIDTPGIHRPKHKLGHFLNQEAAESLKGIDVILWLVEVTAEPTPDDYEVASLLDATGPETPLVVAVNKVDLVDEASLTDRTDRYSQLVHRDHQSVKISATRRDGLTELVDLLVAHCPVRPAEYDEDQVTDLYERDIAADLIREAALVQLRDEVPHAMAVRVDEYKQRENGSAYVAATILVERESQKGIVIGEGGRMLKQIGTKARREIEAMAGHKIYLEIRVKVEKDWRNREAILRQLGYRIKG